MGPKLQNPPKYRKRKKETGNNFTWVSSHILFCTRLSACTEMRDEPGESKVSVCLHGCDSPFEPCDLLILLITMVLGIGMTVTLGWTCCRLGPQL